MLEIKFSHNYPKLHGQKKAVLLAVFRLGAMDVQRNGQLLVYDTQYIGPHGSEFYPLPKEGSLIQLVFIGDLQIPFCTLRKFTEEKEALYRRSIGKRFKIKVE